MAALISLMEDLFLRSEFLEYSKNKLSVKGETIQCNEVVERKYEVSGKIKKSDVFQSITNYIKENMGMGMQWSEFVEKGIENYLSSTISETKLLDLAHLGIAALQYFVQLNWTGPEENKEELPVWPELPSNEDLLTKIALDTECTSSNVQGPQWLLLARIIFINKRACFDKELLVTVMWWAVRCVAVHQAVLEDSSPSLHSDLSTLEIELSDLAPWLAHEQNRDDEESEDKVDESPDFPELEHNQLKQARALFWVELAHARLQYSEVLKSKRCLHQALSSISLKASLIGALGKRTRFQARELPQLTLKVNSLTVNDSGNNVKIEDLPRDIKLNDEVRLPEVNFSAEQDGKFPSLSPVEQSVLLATYGHILKSQPKDAFAEEELLPYLNCILNQPQAWSIQLAALLARCKLEAFHRRTIERSMTQAQLLVDCIGAEKPEACIRLEFIFASQMPPKWKVEAELASLLISLGAVNSALDIFLRLQMWEDVIACYHLLELRHKAAEVVRQELVKKPSPMLWCLLGDATDDVNCYETAWELSQHRSARAQRHWGFYFFSRKEYEQCLPHLEQSLQLNSLQPLVLSRLAFAYLQLEDWKHCASTYRQLCTLDSENFEAWNNLAKAYVKLGEKARAWKVLQESIKCNFENWQVWDNLMVVSIDCAEYQEAIRSYHRLLDLRGTHIDTQVLTIIVKAINGNLPENRGQHAGRLRKQGLELFGRLTSIVTNDARVWQLYAQLAGGQQPLMQQSLEKVMQLLQKAQRSATQAPNWFREVQTCKEAAEISTSLAKTCLQLSAQCSSPNDGVRLLASPRLAINSIITKIKTQHTDPVTNEILPELAECSQQLSNMLEELVKQNKSLLEAAAAT